MSNQTTITLDKLSLTNLRLLGEIKKQESGFPYTTEIWVALVNNRARLEKEAQREHNTEAAAWMADYIEAPWEEITDDTVGYLQIAYLLDNAADKAKENPNALFAAGAFDALADAGATFLADEHDIDAAAAKAAIYTHYGIDF